MDDIFFQSVSGADAVTVSGSDFLSVSSPDIESFSLYSLPDNSEQTEVLNSINNLVTCIFVMMICWFMYQIINHIVYDIL